MTDFVPPSAIRGWLRTGADLELVVVSGSMAPTLAVGDRVRVVSVALAGIRPGDVLVMESENRYVIHRLMCRWPHWRTAGDAVPYFDSVVDPKQIIGRATGVFHMGHWYSLISYPGALPAVIRWLVRSSIHRVRAVIE